MQKHLCIIIDRATREGLAEYEVEAADWYYARHLAAELFKRNFPDVKNDWCVDSLILSDNE